MTRVQQMQFKLQGPSNLHLQGLGTVAYPLSCRSLNSPESQIPTLLYHEQKTLRDQTFNEDFELIS